MIGGLELIRPPVAPGGPTRGTAHPHQKGCVLTIGTFDGLHVGHCALVARTRAVAVQRGLPAGMLSFEPMPREFLQPADPPARLTNFRERWRLLQGQGLDQLWLLPFNAHLRNYSGAAFMQLLQRCGARHVVVGHDFRFGRGAEGSAQWCAEHGREFGFEVEIVAPVQVEAERVSSGAVREALAQGDLSRAQRLLGRPYSMRGRVQRGAQLGRRLGYPTANLPVHRRRVALSGIFAVRVRGLHAMPGRALPEPALPEQGWPGVASLGTRPVVAGQHWLLEAHLFDFAGDLYGRELEVEFVARLRDEQNFSSLGALTEQMHRDAAAARQVLGLPA
ncbi:MAG: bifunctional riboflavin kinase/FAD synthetase [Steroidobacteraceae bacterium]